MKATKKQQVVIGFCKSQLSFWETSNDIKSPTHFCDNEEVFNSLQFDDVISNDSAKKLTDVMDELLTIIRNIK